MLRPLLLIIVVETVTNNRVSLPWELFYVGDFVLLSQFGGITGNVEDMEDNNQKLRVTGLYEGRRSCWDR